MFILPDLNPPMSSRGKEETDFSKPLDNLFANTIAKNRLHIFLRQFDARYRIVMPHAQLSESERLQKFLGLLQSA